MQRRAKLNLSLRILHALVAVFKYSAFFWLLCLVSCGIRQNLKDIHGKQTTSISVNAFTDPIETTVDFPHVRNNFILPRKELEPFSPYIKQLEQNYFLMRTRFDIRQNRYKQKSNFDCWASCIYMLVMHENPSVTSDQFERFNSKIIKAKESASELGVVFELSKYFHPVTHSRPLEIHKVQHSLMSNHPVIVGFENEKSKIVSDSVEGHVRLLVGMTFSFREKKPFDRHKYNLVIDQLVFVDPASDDDFIYMNGEYFKQHAVFSIIPMAKDDLPE